MDPHDPASMSQLLPWINGGGFAIIAALFVWLVRTELPRREVRAAEEREKQRVTASEAIRQLATDFRDEMRLERASHKEEMEAIMIGFDKVVARLDTRLAVEDLKRVKERGSVG